METDYAPIVDNVQESKPSESNAFQTASVLFESAIICKRQILPNLPSAAFSDGMSRFFDDMLFDKRPSEIFSDGLFPISIFQIKRKQNQIEYSINSFCEKI